MRNIEKGVLLAEFFDVDTSKYVPSFIVWVKNTPQYKNYLQKYRILKKKRTFKARRLLSFFESIDLDSLNTMQDVLIIALSYKILRRRNPTQGLYIIL